MKQLSSGVLNGPEDHLQHRPTLRGTVHFVLSRIAPIIPPMNWSAYLSATEYPIPALTGAIYQK